MTTFIRIVLYIGLLIAMASLYIIYSNPPVIKPLKSRGGEVSKSNADIGGEFDLIDQNGDSYSSNNLKGHLSLIYFGFTFCPDVCPASLQKLTEVITTLDKYKIDILPIFITIDPERDTKDLLKSYLGHFHSKFIGLTGSPAKIKEIADKFKVYYAKAENSNHVDNYMIDHTSFVYLMDRKGSYIKHFYLDTKPEEIIEYIRVNFKDFD